MFFFSGVEGGWNLCFVSGGSAIQPARSVPKLKLLEEICRLQFNLETGSSVSGIDKKRGRRESKKIKKPGSQKLYRTNYPITVASSLWHFLFTFPPSSLFLFPSPYDEMLYWYPPVVYLGANTALTLLFLEKKAQSCLSNRNIKGRFSIVIDTALCGV